MRKGFWERVVKIAGIWLDKRDKGDEQTAITEEYVFELSFFGESPTNIQAERLNFWLTC